MYDDPMRHVVSGVLCATRYAFLQFRAYTKLAIAVCPTGMCLLVLVWTIAECLLLVLGALIEVLKSCNGCSVNGDIVTFGHCVKDVNGCEDYNCMLWPWSNDVTGFDSVTYTAIMFCQRMLGLLSDCEHIVAFCGLFSCIFALAQAYIWNLSPGHTYLRWVFLLSHRRISLDLENECI